jgi:hypothetical protein
MQQNNVSDEEARAARAASLRIQIEEMKKTVPTGSAGAPASPRQLINQKMRERFLEQKNVKSDSKEEGGS